MEEKEKDNKRLGRWKLLYNESNLILKTRMLIMQNAWIESNVYDITCASMSPARCMKFSEIPRSVVKKRKEKIRKNLLA